MTTLTRAALVVAAAATLAACDFLEKDPQQSLSSDTIFTDAAGAEAAINGAYSRVQDGQLDLIMMTELAADFMAHTGSFPSWNEVDNHNLATENAEARVQWQDWYQVILQANLILENIDGAEGIEAARVNAITGEALTMRAYAYHNLVRWFGGVPIVTTGVVDIENVDTPRNSVDEVYDFIIADLERARDLVSETRPAAFIDRDATLGLLARVLLYDGQYERAGQIAADVASRHPLASNYADLFGGLGNDEIIWGLQFTISDSNSLAFHAFTAPAGGRYEYGPTVLGIAAYDTDGDGDADSLDTDARFDYNLTVQDERPVFFKYRDVVNGTDSEIILRAAEMVLIQAEAAARAGNYDEAVTLVNRLRTRAGAPAVSADGVDTLDEALAVILSERAIELWGEAHRWHDLVRTDRAVPVLDNLDNEQFTLWPIPRREIDLNSQLTQNPGY